MGKIVRVLLGVAIACVLAALVTGCSGASKLVDSVEANDEFGTGVHHVSIEVEGYSPFTIEVDAETAPVTASTFLHLVKNGYYDGRTFHRMVNGFCLQGGSPSGDGNGGNGTAIVGEFSANNVENKLAENYARGVVAMARTNDYNSASTQFFVTVSDAAAPSLNGLYAAFGTIDEEGMAVVDSICAACKDSADPGNGYISDRGKQPKIVTAKVVD